MQYIQLALAAVFTTGFVNAAPAGNDGTSVNAVNPFAGVSITPYSEENCSGDGQSNTNVNLGTTACINWSNAQSFQITIDECKTSPYVEYFHNTGCPDSETPYTTEVLGATSSCYNFDQSYGFHGSGRLSCYGPSS